MRTWDSPEVADLAWAARTAGAASAARPRARVLAGAAAERAVRELLAVQASDWAFLDRRRQAGDYPWQRTTDHARALLEAINSQACQPEPAGPQPRRCAICAPRPAASSTPAASEPLNSRTLHLA